MTKYICAYGRTYYFYGVCYTRNQLKQEIKDIKRKRPTTKIFVRRIRKGYLMPEITYEIYITRR